MATKLEQQIDKALAVLSAHTKPVRYIVRKPRRPAGKARVKGSGRVKYDVIYYWVGGSLNGEWKATLGYSEQMLDDLKHMGYVAHPGRLSIGPPEGAPSMRQRDAALTAHLPKGLKQYNKRLRRGGKGRAPLFEIGPYVLWRHRSDGRWHEVRSYANEDSATYDADTIIGGGGRAKVTFHGERIYPRGTSRRGGKPRKRRARPHR